METSACPVIRQDLTLYPAEHDPDGQPCWFLHDPLSNRYFRLGQRLIELLPFLDSPDTAKAAQTASQNLNRSVEQGEIADLCQFLRQNHLVRSDIEQRQIYQQVLNRKKQSVFTSLARRYLFIRVPLLNPDPWLTRSLSRVRWLASPTLWWVYLLSMLAGLGMLVRQPDQFLATFLHLFTFQGLFAYFVVLFAVKSLHELGHAFVAKHYGCRVPIIGVAFLVGWPVLYTDTTDAWKLLERHKRMRIVAAGMLVESVLAGFCLLGWGLVEDGLLRSVFFLIATSSLLMTLVVNLNPLMRFDGYFLFSDWLRLPNLEQRAFAVGRWRLREWLFAYGEVCPDPGRQRLAWFAFAVWIYRFFLFLGIALLVYQFFFKAAGLILFAVELAYFIGLPILRELGQWRVRMWRKRLPWRAHITLMLAVLGVSGLFVPWQTTITAPAVLTGAYQSFYAPRAGMLLSALPEPGRLVAEGDALVELNSDVLDLQLLLAREKLALARHQLGTIGFSESLRRETPVIKSRLKGLAGEVAELERQQSLMILRAKGQGEVVERMQGLTAGDWVAAGQRLVGMVDKSRLEVVAFPAAEVIQRIGEEGEARFIPEQREWPAYDLVLASIDPVGLTELDMPYLASVHQGSIAVRPAEDGRLRLQEGRYRSRFKVVDAHGAAPDIAPDRVVRGEVQIQGRAESLAARGYRWIGLVLQRERGF